MKEIKTRTEKIKIYTVLFQKTDFYGTQMKLWLGTAFNSEEAIEEGMRDLGIRDSTMKPVMYERMEIEEILEDASPKKKKKKVSKEDILEAMLKGDTTPYKKHIQNLSEKDKAYIIEEYWKRMGDNKDAT